MKIGRRRQQRTVSELRKELAQVHAKITNLPMGSQGHAYALGARDALSWALCHVDVYCPCSKSWMTRARVDTTA